MGREIPTGQQPARGTWPLPRGQHKLPREVVSANQRTRLLSATASALAKRGYNLLSVQDIIEEAGVSRTTFYEHFTNKQDCVRVAHQEAFDHLAAVIFRACASGYEWPAKVDAAVRAAVRFAVESPAEARLLIYDSVGADPVLAAQVLASNEHLVGLLRAGREHAAQAQLPDLTERALIGAVTSIVGNRLMLDQVDRLEEIEAELVQLMLIPYVGSAEAKRFAA